MMLDVSNLSVAFKMGEAFVPVTHGVSFSLSAGATVPASRRAARRGTLVVGASCQTHRHEKKRKTTAES